MTVVGMSFSQSSILSTFMDVAVAICCRLVFFKPRYRALRRPKARRRSYSQVTFITLLT